VEPAMSAAEEIRRLRATGKIDPQRAALIRNARNVRNARVAMQVLNAAAGVPPVTPAAKPVAGGLPPRKRGA
jgi:hypothetical protein